MKAADQHFLRSALARLISGAGRAVRASNPPKASMATSAPASTVVASIVAASAGTPAGAASMCPPICQPTAISANAPNRPAAVTATSESLTLKTRWPKTNS